MARGIDLASRGTSRFDQGTLLTGALLRSFPFLPILFFSSSFFSLRIFVHSANAPALMLNVAWSLHIYLSKIKGLHDASIYGNTVLLSLPIHSSTSIRFKFARLALSPMWIARWSIVFLFVTRVSVFWSSIVTAVVVTSTNDTGPWPVTLFCTTLNCLSDRPELEQVHLAFPRHHVVRGHGSYGLAESGKCVESICVCSNVLEPCLS